MSQSPRQDPINQIELNSLVRSPGLQKADYRPEATSPDAKPRSRQPLDKATLIVSIVVVIAVIAGVVWVLHTGGFGTPPPPTPVP